MPLFLCEDEGNKLGKRQITLPQELVNALNQRANFYSGDEYKTTNGYKRLHSLLDKHYNSQSDRKDRQHGNLPTISFSDAKRIDHDIRHMSQSADNVEYDMIGGDQMRDFLKSSLDGLRNSVHEVPKAAEPAKLENDDVKPDDIEKVIKIGKSEIRIENKEFNNKIKKIF